jgi:hypothetical protein
VREYGVTDILQFFSAMGFRAETVVYRGGGPSGRWFPKTLRPFLTFVFTKVSPARPVPTSAPIEQPAFQARPVKLWMLVYSFVVIGPIIVWSWISERFLLRWLVRRMGYPVVR